MSLLIAKLDHVEESKDINKRLEDVQAPLWLAFVVYWKLGYFTGLRTRFLSPLWWLWFIWWRHCRQEMNLLWKQQVSGLFFSFTWKSHEGVDWLISPYIELFYLHAPLFKYYVVQILKTKWRELPRNAKAIVRLHRGKPSQTVPELGLSDLKILRLDLLFSVLLTSEKYWLAVWYDSSLLIILWYYFFC